MPLSLLEVSNNSVYNERERVTTIKNIVSVDAPHRQCSIKHCKHAEGIYKYTHRYGERHTTPQQTHYDLFLSLCLCRSADLICSLCVVVVATPYPPSQHRPHDHGAQAFDVGAASVASALSVVRDVCLPSAVFALPAL